MIIELCRINVSMRKYLDPSYIKLHGTERLAVFPSHPISLPRGNQSYWFSVYSFRGTCVCLFKMYIHKQIHIYTIFNLIWDVISYKMHHCLISSKLNYINFYLILLKWEEMCILEVMKFLKYNVLFPSFNIKLHFAFFCYKQHNAS